MLESLKFARDVTSMAAIICQTNALARIGRRVTRGWRISVLELVNIDTSKASHVLGRLENLATLFVLSLLLDFGLAGAVTVPSLCVREWAGLRANLTRLLPSVKQVLRVIQLKPVFVRSFRIVKDLGFIIKIHAPREGE